MILGPFQSIDSQRKNNKLIFYLDFRLVCREDDHVLRHAKPTTAASCRIDRLSEIAQPQHWHCPGAATPCLHGTKSIKKESGGEGTRR